MTPLASDAYAPLLLDWWNRDQRRLPWRGAVGATPDPYAVWLSEIMLQQTTAQTVGPYFLKFLERWPTVQALAQAPLDDVLAAWAGLGYYARARNLHKCAQLVTARWRGRFPTSVDELKKLPGVGDYTAGAVAAIAFDQPAAAIDGNVERVVARLFAVDAPPAEAKTRMRALAEAMVPTARPGDYAQAMMDLGAEVCTPRNPACGLCPFMAACVARAQDDPERFPIKLAKPDRPTRRAVAFWAVRADGAVLLRRRPEKGLLGGMLETPSSPWLEGPMDLDAALRAAPMAAPWRVLEGTVVHIFTHFRLELTVAAAKMRLGDPKLGRWTPVDTLNEVALPTLFRKVASHALKRGG